MNAMNILTFKNAKRNETMSDLEVHNLPSALIKFTSHLILLLSQSKFWLGVLLNS